MSGKKVQDRFLWAMGAWRLGGDLAGRYKRLSKSERLWVRYYVERGRSVSDSVQQVMFFGIPEGRVR